MAGRLARAQPVVASRPTAALVLRALDQRRLHPQADACTLAAWRGGTSERAISLHFCGYPLACRQRRVSNANDRDLGRNLAGRSCSAVRRARPERAPTRGSRSARAARKRQATRGVGWYATRRETDSPATPTLRYASLTLPYGSTIFDGVTRVASVPWQGATSLLIRSSRVSWPVATYGIVRRFCPC